MRYSADAAEMSASKQKSNCAYLFMCFKCPVVSQAAHCEANVEGISCFKIIEGSSSMLVVLGTI